MMNSKKGVDPATFFGLSEGGEDDERTKRSRTEWEAWQSAHAPKVARYELEAQLSDGDVYRTFPLQQDAFACFDSLAGAPGLRVFAAETSKGGGARRFIVATFNAFWCRHADSDKHFYELIRDGQPCRLYFDIEFARARNPGRDGDAMVRRFVARLSRQLEMAYGLELLSRDVVDLDSTTADKFSRHLIAHIREDDPAGPPGARREVAAFRDNQHVGAFVRLLAADILREASEGCPDMGSLLVRTDGTAVGSGGGGCARELFVDLGVYSRNRTFRLYLSRKRGKEAVLRWSPQCQFVTEGRNAPSVPPAALSSAGDNLLRVDRCTREQVRQEFLDSLVGFADADVAAGPQPEAVLQPCGRRLRLLACDDGCHARAVAASGAGAALRSSSSVAAGLAGSGGAIDPSPFPGLDDFVASTLRTVGTGAGHIKSWLHLPGPNPKVTYQIVGDRYCGRVGRQHKSNGVYFVADLAARTLVQRCHDAACKQANFRSEPWPVPELALERPPDPEMGAKIAERVGPECDAQPQRHPSSCERQRC